MEKRLKPLYLTYIRTFVLPQCYGRVYLRLRGAACPRLSLSFSCSCLWSQSTMIDYDNGGGGQGGRTLPLPPLTSPSRPLVSLLSSGAGRAKRAQKCPLSPPPSLSSSPLPPPIPSSPSSLPLFSLLPPPLHPPPSPSSPPSRPLFSPPSYPVRPLIMDTFYLSFLF